MYRYLPVLRFKQFFAVVFVVVFVLVNFFINSQLSLLVGALFLGVYSGFGIHRNPPTLNVLLIFCLFSILVAPALFVFNHGFSTFFYYVSTVISFFAARQLASIQAEMVLMGLRCSFYAFFVLCITLFYLHRAEPEPFGAILEGASTNGIPSYFIVLQVVLSIVTYLVMGRLPLMTPLLTLVIAVLGIGRGSILAASAIVLISVVFNFLQDLNYRRWGGMFFWGGIVLCVLVVCGINFDFLFNYVSSKTNLSRGLYDPARADMISDYLGQLSIISLFSGGGFEGTVISQLYGNNPHNSFIRAHSYMGLGVFLLIVFSPFLVFFSGAKMSEKTVCFTFLLILLFRAISEPILFPTLLDFFYFFIFFFFYRRAAERQRPSVVSLSESRWVRA
ncbi:hypothetical protein [Pseudomonas soli]|uniref:hypothetical protein n=1 Tax=Pseudomonas soli TaxID=1306993 RepID=UPI0028A7E79B|nr:hypothetical protein [Pseudomonas soli]